MQCSASTTLEARYPETEESPDARDGTAAHWAVSETLAGRLVDVGEMAPNGIFLTKEMVDGADLICDDITRELAGLPFGLKPSQGQIEQRVQIPAIHSQSWGTPDYSFCVQAGERTTILLYDYKFGHKHVEVYENWQLIEYLAGVMNTLPWPVKDQFIDVRARIVQPRSFHRDGPVRRWDFNASAVRAQINIASHAAHEALGPNPVARTGPECYGCKARAHCPTLQASAYRIVDEAKRPQPLELPPAALGLELSMLRKAQVLLDARVSGLEAQAMSQIKAGKNVRMFAIEHTAGRESWTVPAEQVIAVAKMLDLDIAKPPEPITPNQAREKGLDPALVAQFSKRSPGGAKLVEQDSTDAKRIFG